MQSFPQIRNPFFPRVLYIKLFFPHILNIRCLMQFNQHLFSLRNSSWNCLFKSLKMIHTFKPKAFVKTHCKLIVPISSHGEKILHLVRGFYVWHFSEHLILLFIFIEISWQNNIRPNILVKTDFWEDVGRQEVVSCQIESLIFVLNITDVVVAHRSSSIRLTVKKSAGFCNVNNGQRIRLI